MYWSCHIIIDIYIKFYSFIDINILFPDVFTVHIRTVGGWTRKVHELFTNKQDTTVSNEIVKVVQKPERKHGSVLNPTFISPSLEDKLESDKKKSTGARYMSNLREFNRKMSSVAKPAILMVETEKKLVQHGVLERKKSSSLSSLTRGGFLYDELYNIDSSASDSGRSSLTGSQSSLRRPSLEGNESLEKSAEENSPTTTQKRVEVYLL